MKLNLSKQKIILALKGSHPKLPDVKLEGLIMSVKDKPMAIVAPVPAMSPEHHQHEHVEVIT